MSSTFYIKKSQNKGSIAVCRRGLQLRLQSYRFLFGLLFIIGIIYSPLRIDGQNLSWVKTIGGPGYDSGASIAVDAAGNNYTTGTFQGTTDFDPGPGNFNLTSAGEIDIFISKLDKNGSFLWAISMGGPEIDKVHSIAVDPLGNVYTIGRFEGTSDFNPGAGNYNLTSTGDYDVFISKLDNYGNFVWAKQIGEIGAPYNYSLALDAGGNVVICGTFFDTADFDPGPDSFYLTPNGSGDIFIAKLDNNGYFLWAANLGGEASDQGESVAVDAAGNIYVTGGFALTADFDPGTGVYNLTSAGFLDIFITKLDNNGNFLWVKSIGGNLGQSAYSITLDGVGNIYTTGYFYGTPDFDPGQDTFQLTAAGSNDIFICKWNHDGEFIWAKNLGGPQNDVGKCIDVDESGNVYTTGIFHATADFDPGPGNFDLTFIDHQDIFVSKLDNNGDFVWALAMGGIEHDHGYSIACDQDGNVFSTGYINGAVSYRSGIDTFNLTALNNDVYILKVSSLPSGNQDIPPGIDAKIIPNPASSWIYLETEETVESINLINMMGEVLQKETNKSFSIEGLPAGVYLIQINTSKGMGNFVFIKN